MVQQARGVGHQLRADTGRPGDAFEREASAAQLGPRLTSQQPLRVVVGGGGDRSAVQLYSGSAAASYARTWALGTNPAYPRFSNDCTNFVSQALLSGGWTMVHSPMTSMAFGPGLEVARCVERTLDGVWWYDKWYCLWPGVRASYTWAGAQNLYNFMRASGRGSAAGYVRDLDIGDVLQMDFGSGTIHHTMIVTGKRDGELYLSYHTSDHLDEPFWATGGIFSRYPSANYYAWKL